MAVLDQGIETTERPGEGRFFMPIALDNLRSDVVAQADVLRQQRIQSGPSFESRVGEFEERFLALDQGLTDVRGETAGVHAFRILYPERLVSRTNAYDRLTEHYKVKQQEQGPTRSVVVPTAAINTHKLLRFPGEGDYNYYPVVDMRIQTRTDPVIQIYTLEGLQDLPGTGLWYRFPLADVEIQPIMLPGGSER
ncbi:MAG TPA: hypothetical protein PKA02_00670 [Candidatus Saccharibacteria bacterium]|nr:hypothetical protein [Candidatus Saccharibacteria bacterium]